MSDSTPHLFLFLSVDIIDSTKLKYRKANPINWYNSFRDFYVAFPDEFKSKLSIEYNYRSISYSEEKLTVWKYAGDEILFFIEIKNNNEVPCIINAFKNTLEYWIENEDEKKLEIKGTAWIGQTPFIDRKIDDIPGSDNIDFIGPSIDCGFRIGKYSSRSEIAISVEVADLCKDFDPLKPNLFYLKSENLKGVFGDKNKYPIFVININKISSKEYDYLRTACDTSKLDAYISHHYDLLSKEYNQRPLVSRIIGNIDEYLSSKESISKQITDSDTGMKPINDELKLVDDTTQDNPEVKGEIEGIISQITK